VLNVKEKPKHYDATDALAVALCHWHQINRPVISTGKGLKGWDDFIQKNPARLKK
jgi:crossover junction endodeoxyribonuclease RuvC